MSLRLERGRLLGPARAMHLIALMALVGVAASPIDVLSAAPTQETAGIKDRCRAMPGYTAFRDRLERAVRDRNSAAFNALISTRAGRIDGELGQSTAGPAANHPIWKELDLILTLGCGTSGRNLILPYVGSLDPDLAADRQFVIIEAAAVRRLGRADAPAVGRVARGEIVSQIGNPEHPSEGWTYLTLRNHRTGFVPNSTLRPFADRALELVREDEEWRIVYFGGMD